MQYKKGFFSLTLVILGIILFSNTCKAIGIDELEKFQNSHFEHINELCISEDLIIKETCFILNSGYFIKSMSILKEKNGINYFNECYNTHYKEDNIQPYQFIYECVQSYSDLVNYKFLNKEYNYIFLEEDNIFLNITNSCVSNKNIKDINNCIRKQKESFNFFKINFFNEINHSKENVFRVCLKQNSTSKYDFDFKKINTCIKENSF